jgi:serine protease Do
VNRGYIGVTIQPVNPTMAKALKMSKPEGVLVFDVLKNGSAERAGLRQGDVILEVDGHKVNTPNHLQSLVAQKRAGQEVKLKVWRDGSIIDRSVRLKPREETETLATAEDAREEMPREGLDSDRERNTKLSGIGMEVRPIDPQTRRNRDISEGVMIGKVDLYGEAMNQGLREGDIILSVNRKGVKTPADFQKIVDAASPGDVLLLQVKTRTGTTGLVALEVKK